MNEYDGKQFVAIDLHRRQSVIVRQSESGEQLSAVRIVNDRVALGLQLEQAEPIPVLPEATFGHQARLQRPVTHYLWISRRRPRLPVRATSLSPPA